MYHERTNQRTVLRHSNTLCFLCYLLFKLPFIIIMRQQRGLEYLGPEEVSTGVPISVLIKTFHSNALCLLCGLYNEVTKKVKSVGMECLD